MAPPLVEGEAAAKSDRDLLLELMDKMTNALTTLSSPPEVNEATVRATKLEKLYGFFIKHTNLKQYKPYDSIDVRLWLNQFDAAVDLIASAGCNLDLTTNPLSSAEFAKLLKTKINYQVESEISQSLSAISRDWSTASIAEVRTAMHQLYMRREPQVCSILKMFSIDRIKKGNLSVSAYYAKWKENLAPCIDVKTDPEKIICHDLVLKASFYGGIDDPYIIKEISNIPEEKQTLKSMLEGALSAEARAIHLKDTLNRSHAIDNASELKTSTTSAVSRTD